MLEFTRPISEVVTLVRNASRWQHRMVNGKTSTSSGTLHQNENKRNEICMMINSSTRDNENEVLKLRSSICCMPSVSLMPKGFSLFWSKATERFLQFQRVEPCSFVYRPASHPLKCLRAALHQRFHEISRSPSLTPLVSSCNKSAPTRVYQQY